LCALLKKLDAASRRLVLIADRGLLTREVIHYYVTAGIGFIGCILATKDEDNAIAAVPHEELLAAPLSYRPSRLNNATDRRKAEERYYGVRRQVTLSGFTNNETGVKLPSITLDGLVVLAEGKRRLDAQKREDMLSKQESRLAEIDGHLNNGRYKNKDFTAVQIEKTLRKYPAVRGMVCCELTVSDSGILSLTWQRDVEAINKAAMLDGKYIVFTTESQLSNDALLTHYKSRDKVEKRVGVMKGPVAVRPIYLHKDERILGLLFGTMMGLLIFGLTEMEARSGRIEISGEELQKLFADYSASVLVFDDGSQAMTPPTGNKWQRQLLQAIHVERLTLQQVAPELQLHVAAPPECPWTRRDDTDDSTSPTTVRMRRECRKQAESIPTATTAVSTVYL
jgi:transposase